MTDTGTAVAEFVDLVSEEFATWAQTLSVQAPGGSPAWDRRSGTPLYWCPDPNSDGGLPAGWRVAAMGVADWSEQTFYVVERHAGGWLVVNHYPPLHRTQVVHRNRTLAGLHQDAADAWEAMQRTTTYVVTVEWMAQWLGEVLVCMSEPADEAEAAEQMLVALKGGLRIFPRDDLG